MAPIMPNLIFPLNQILYGPPGTGKTYQTINYALSIIEQRPVNELIEEEIVLVYSAPHEITEEEILFELKNHLASYMIPSKVVYKKSLPLVQSDKNQVNKDELKREITA